MRGYAVATLLAEGSCCVERRLAWAHRVDALCAQPEKEVFSILYPQGTGERIFW